MIQVIERSIVLNHLYDLDKLGDQVWLRHGETLVRFVVEEIKDHKYYCSISTIAGTPINSQFQSDAPKLASELATKDDGKFRVALVIPTGLGASVGGNAGDGGATARLMASVCDQLITHPNVVNASDFNEMTDNTWYVEGYTLTQYLLGNIGLEGVRQNRVLVVVDGSAEPAYVHAAINAVNAARVTYGFDCPKVVVLDNPFAMETGWSSKGRAAGSVANLDQLFEVLARERDSYDAVALTSLIGIPDTDRDYYYKNGGVNPWGGVEAMLTHAVSHVFGVPCAHAPMMESQEIDNMDFGVVDPRCSAETVSVTYLPCVLKGLNRAPRIIDSSPDVSCLVIPQRCLGIPMLAAYDRDIPIIVVDDELEVDDVNCLDYIEAISVDNYVEAVGVVAAMRAGISVESLGRPMGSVEVRREGSTNE